MGIREVVRGLWLTGLLFAGPLFGYFVVEKGWEEWVRLGPVKEVWGEWTSWRNIVAVGFPFFSSIVVKPSN